MITFSPIFIDFYKRFPMKKLLLFLLIPFTIISCDDGSSPGKDYYKMLGKVKVIVKKTAEDGSVLGKMYIQDDISEVQVELLTAQKVVQTVYSKYDTAGNGFYLFDKLKDGKRYKVRVTLNEAMIEETDEFTFHSDNLTHILKDTIDERSIQFPDWIPDGDYYVDLLYDNDRDAIFETDNKVIGVYPMPINTMTSMQFNNPFEQQVSIRILRKDLTQIDMIYNRVMKAGKHTLRIDFTDIGEPGLYIAHIMLGEEEYYEILWYYSM